MEACGNFNLVNRGIMTDISIKVTLEGTFPKEDIAMIADYHNLPGADDSEKLDAIVANIEDYIVEYLAGASRKAIANTYATQMDADLAALNTRVRAALSSESEEV